MQTFLKASLMISLVPKYQMFYNTQYKYIHAFIISSEYIDFIYATSFPIYSVQK